MPLEKIYDYFRNYDKILIRLLPVWETNLQNRI